MADLRQFIESTSIYMKSRGIGNIIKTPNGWTYVPNVDPSKNHPIFETNSECFDYLKRLPESDLVGKVDGDTAES